MRAHHDRRSTASAEISDDHTSINCLRWRSGNSARICCDVALALAAPILHRLPPHQPSRPRGTPRLLLRVLWAIQMVFTPDEFDAFIDQRSPALHIAWMFRELSARFLQRGNFRRAVDAVTHAKEQPVAAPLHASRWPCTAIQMSIPAAARQAIFLGWTESRAIRSRKVRCWFEDYPAGGQSCQWPVVYCTGRQPHCPKHLDLVHETVEQAIYVQVGFGRHAGVWHRLECADDGQCRRRRRRARFLCRQSPILS